jgi:excisionase family DNA binding protein
MMRHLGGYLKPWEASSYLGIPVEEVYRMLEQGELPGLLIDSQWRVPLDKLEEWLDEEVYPEELVKLSKHLPGIDERKIKTFLRTEQNFKNPKTRTRKSKKANKKSR